MQHISAFSVKCSLKMSGVNFGSIQSNGTIIYRMFLVVVKLSGLWSGTSALRMQHSMQWSV
jgi:hypothetical protein